MRTNAILLIDLENFFLGREENVCSTPAPHIYSFKEDLEKLYNFAVDLAGERRLAVRRAYANYNVWRMTKEGGPKEYYLQQLPNLLMDKGIEPVQVFRFPGGGNKNASDMRLAMDATALLNDQAGVDLFILVTGDADFIPLVLELKRRGAEVAVIGVMWHTKPVFQRYCDRFEYFEDLVAAQEIEADSVADLAQVRHALQTLLARSQPIKFAAVKPLLGRSLNRTFDPTRFDCLDTGDFLRRYSSELGIAVRKGEHDWEIMRPGAADASDDAAASAEATPAVPPPASVALFTPPFTGLADYRELLERGTPRVYLVPSAQWQAITERLFHQATGQGEERPIVYYYDLLRSLTASCEQQGMLDAERRVKAVTFQVFKAGCLMCADGAAGPNPHDFNWARPARLDPGLASVEDIRRRTHGFIVSLLQERLQERGWPRRIDAGRLAELLFGPGPTPEQVQELQALADNLDGDRPA
ncbi:MAG TPA: NYN domain-containing protein [Gemmataceae bacterium]|nr:NYN domain-containing protein [Gemmataceae bacterium]